LQRGNRLTEKQCYRSEVRVARAVEVTDFFILLGATCGIVHVAQMVFALDVVLVVADQLILWEF
jgi:hypothetical protein